MNRLWISIAILVSVICLCAYELFKIRDLSEKSEQNISEMQQYIIKNDFSSALKISQETNEMWENNNTLIAMFVQHEPLENIEQSLAVISVSIVQNNLQDFWTESTKASIQITKLSDTDIPSLGNIF